MNEALAQQQTTSATTPVATTAQAPTVVALPRKRQNGISLRAIASPGHERRPATDFDFRFVAWLARLALVVAEPLRVLSRRLLHGVKEPRYTGARHGMVIVHRPVRDGLRSTLLWNTRREVYGSFEWDRPTGRQELACSLLRDYLQCPPPASLCEDFAEKAFPKAPAGGRWTLTTRQIEHILLACVEEPHATDSVAVP